MNGRKIKFNNHKNTSAHREAKLLKFLLKLFAPSICSFFGRACTTKACIWLALLVGSLFFNNKLGVDDVKF